MRQESEKAFECRVMAPQLWAVPLACLQALAGCTAEVELFKSPDQRAAGAIVATTAATDAAKETDTRANTNTFVVTQGAAPARNADGSCQPGHYVGAFHGTYNSAAWGNGSETLSIAATPSMGRPGLEFWLEQIPRNCASDQEFCPDFIVKGGKIRGFANPFSNNNPASNASDGAPVLVIHFEIDFGGNLDCSSGQFRGLLENGCYDVATILFRFDGIAPANYDADSASFNDGMWMVKELPSADAWFQPDENIGGMGSWEASLSNDAESPPAASAGLCDKR